LNAGACGKVSRQIATPSFVGLRRLLSEKRVQLQDVVPWGRSFDEYRRMFALSGEDLSHPILGCGDGPASFNATGAARGARIVSCDPLYVFRAADIDRRIRECSFEVLSQVRLHAHDYVWDDFRDPDDLKVHRLAAMREFLEDFERPESRRRYVAAALPRLPFGDRSFSLALVSHLLFLYSGHLDLAFHVAAVEELLRVASELRIFPIVALDGRRSPYVDAVRNACEEAGIRCTVRAVPYHFQRGAFEMLHLAREGAPSGPD